MFTRKCGPPAYNGAPFARCKHRPVELFCVLLRTMRPDSPQWRTHDLAQQERQSRRAPIHFGLSGWRRAPPLHTHNLDRAWERDRDGKQYRGARVALGIVSQLLASVLWLFVPLALYRLLKEVDQALA